RSCRPSESSTSATRRPIPTTIVARRNSRRPRTAASAPRSGNELLGGPPEEGTGRKPDRSAEDRGADEGAEVRMDRIARPEYDGGPDDGPGACALERHAIVHRRRGSARGVGRQFALEHEVDRAVAGGGDPEGKAAAVCLHVDRVEKRCPRDDARIERYVAEGEPHHGEPEPDELLAPGRV